MINALAWEMLCELRRSIVSGPWTATPAILAWVHAGAPLTDRESGGSMPPLRVAAVERLLRRRHA